MDALFSIIVPVYKAEEYLPQCIESILQQAYPDFELILVDDGSPDRCGEICDEYAKKDARIKVIHQENKGRVNARNEGLRKATYNYILNVDSDDYIDRNLLTGLFEVIQKNDPDIIAFGLTKVSEDGAFISYQLNGSEEGLYTNTGLHALKEKLVYDKTKKYINGGSVQYSVCTKVFKKELIEKAQCNVPEEIAVGEDLAVTVLAVCNCRSVYVLNNCGYMYRQVSTSTMRTFDEKEIAQSRVLLDYLQKAAPEINDESIGLYCFMMALIYIFKAMQSAAGYRQVKNVLDSQKDERCVQNCINVNPKNLGWKDKIKWFCIKYRLWWVFWLLRK